MLVLSDEKVDITMEIDASVAHIQGFGGFHQGMPEFPHVEVPAVCAVARELDKTERSADVVAAEKYGFS